MKGIEYIQNKVCLFDFDGTLGNSMPTMVEILFGFLTEYNIPITSELANKLVPLGFAGMAKYYQEELGVPMPKEEILQTFMRRLVKAYEERICLKPTVKETVKALKEAGFRLCVFTASPHIFIDPCLKREGAYELFDKVWSVEDFGLTKGEETIFVEAAKRLGVKVEDLAVIDDSLTVLKTAKAAGATTVGVYEPTMEKLQEEIRATADFYITEMSQLLTK